MRSLLLSSLPLLVAGVATGTAAAATGGSAAATSEESAAPPDLSVHRWRHRVLVLDTPATSDARYERQAAALLAAWPGLLDRDLWVVTRAGGDVSAFRLRLVGKDGGVKLDSPEPVEAEALFALIDAMPMRRAEAADRAR